MSTRGEALIEAGQVVEVIRTVDLDRIALGRGVNQRHALDIFHRGRIIGIEHALGDLFQGTGKEGTDLLEFTTD